MGILSGIVMFSFGFVSALAMGAIFMIKDQKRAKAIPKGTAGAKRGRKPKLDENKSNEGDGNGK